MPSPFDAQLIIRDGFQLLARRISAELRKDLPDTLDRPPALGGLTVSLGGGRGVRRASQAGVRALAGRLAGGGGGLPDPGSTEEAGCPACLLHRQMADARGLADGLVQSAAPDGTLPSPQAGTVPLIRATLSEAERQLDVVAQGRPDLGPKTEGLRRQLEAAKYQCPEGRTLNAQDARRLQEAVTPAWASAYDLAKSYWSGPPRTSAVRDTYRAARAQGWTEDEFMDRLRERVSSDNR